MKTFMVLAAFENVLSTVNTWQYLIRTHLSRISFHFRYVFMCIYEWLWDDVFHVLKLKILFNETLHWSFSSFVFVLQQNAAHHHDSFIHVNILTASSQNIHYVIPAENCMRNIWIDILSTYTFCTVFGRRRIATTINYLCGKSLRLPSFAFRISHIGTFHPMQCVLTSIFPLSSASNFEL